MVRAMNVTRLRSISLIFPAATSRSSASALHWERFPFPIPRELQGILGPNR